VELIVLNVGLSAGILDQRVFSMFVLEALVLTFMTTPIVTILYPPHLRVRVTATGANFNNVDGEAARNQPPTRRPRTSGSAHSDDTKWRTRFTVVLDKVEHLPAMMSLTQLIHPSPPPPYSSDHSSISSLRLSSRRDVSIDALRLIELSDRVSAVMKGSATDTLLHTDPTLEIYRTFGDINGVDVATSLAIVSFDDLAVSVVDHARNKVSHLVLLPWLPPGHNSESPKDPGSDSHPSAPTHHHSSTNPFDALFKATHGGTAPTSVVHSQFVREVFSLCPDIDVALYIDPVARSPGDVFRKSTAYHLVLPFFGGPDDRMALEWAVQLCSSVRVSATVIRVRKEDIKEEVRKPSEAHVASSGEKGQGIPILEHPTIQHTITSVMDTVYAQHNTQTRMQSETADNLTWGLYADGAEKDGLSEVLREALGRVEFVEMGTPKPLHAIVGRVNEAVDSMSRRNTRVLAMIGRSRRLAAEDHTAELKEVLHNNKPIGGEVRKTIGDVGTALVVSGVKAGVVVLQAANPPG
jgi:hypothetical protein